MANNDNLSTRERELKPYIAKVQVASRRIQFAGRRTQFAIRHARVAD